jgi:hypothetical protein
VRGVHDKEPGKSDAPLHTRVSRVPARCLLVRPLFLCYRRTHYQDTQVNKCILKNGTGVRLVVRKPDSSGLDPYQPPAILEPGENAFFLFQSSEFIGGVKTAGLSLTMNIQVFQGPMGWLPDDNPQEDVTVAEGKTGGRPTKTISTFVDVGGGTKYPTEIDFDVGGSSLANDLFVIKVTQYIRA